MKTFDHSQFLTFQTNMLTYLNMSHYMTYQIYYIQQEDEQPLNRGLLYNIGFAEAVQTLQFDCLIFHDINLIPKVQGIPYRCNSNSIRLFPGVTTIARTAYQRINGWSNLFGGLDGVEDDLYQRLMVKGIGQMSIREQLISYRRIKENEEQFPYSEYGFSDEAGKNIKNDGYSSLEYEVLRFNRERLFIHIQVKIPNLKPGNFTKNIF